MKVAVITPYYKESLDILTKCHASVLKQTYKCTHILVADGNVNSEMDNWNADHIKLPKSHNDIGSTPRLIGCYHAIGLGYDAVAFLDADNWFDEKHIESLVSLYQSTQASFLYSNRYLCRLDDSIIKTDEQIFPPKFVDTNCMMFTSSGFHILHKWVLMPSYGHLIGDRVMTFYIKESGVKIAYTELPTVYYRCNKEGVYKANGEIPPERTLPRPDYEKSFKLWEEDGNPKFN